MATVSTRSGPLPAVRAFARHPAAVGAALLLVALNLRFAIAAVSPVLDDLRAGLGLSSVGAGLLTTAPVLCFAAAAPLAPIVARRVGQELLLLVCTLVVAAGVAIRAVPSIAPVFAGTLVLGIAIAVANVLIPSVIKRRFARPGTMMALYTTSLGVSAAVAAALLGAARAPRRLVALGARVLGRPGARRRRGLAAGQPRGRRHGDARQ